MSKLPKYSEFAKILNEAHSVADDIKAYFDIAKKLKRGNITTPLDYQPFDKEAFFEFSNNGHEYRVHYSKADNEVRVTNMDTNEETLVINKDEFINILN